MLFVLSLLLLLLMLLVLLLLLLRLSMLAPPVRPVRTSLFVGRVSLWRQRTPPLWLDRLTLTEQRGEHCWWWRHLGSANGR